MAEPPFEAGAVNETVSVPSVEVMPEIVGAPGTVAAAWETLAEAEPYPATFLARIRTAYVWLALRPEIGCGLVRPENATHAPESRLYWYSVMAEPPSSEGTVNATENEPAPGEMLEMVGADGGEIVEMVPVVVASRDQPTEL